MDWSRTIALAPIDCSTLCDSIATILHELRHAEQIDKHGKTLKFQYASWQEYFDSPEERDARQYEDLAADVLNIYNSRRNLSDKILRLIPFNGTQL